MMTDKRKQRDEAGDGTRRRVRVTVGRKDTGEPADDPATIADERTASPTGDAADERAAYSGDAAAAAGPATAAGQRDPAEADEAADPTAAAEAVTDEVEAIMAEASVAELAKAEAERDLYLDQLQRLKAEFDNYRKRLQRDSEALRLRAAEGLVESLLPVIDNMERALEAAGKHEENKLVEGVQLVSGQLRSVLASQGLEEVPVEPGVPFDPTVHEAVLTQESPEYPEGTIAAVIEKGYLLHGRLLRPVKVIVAR
jgi:molecular chaperone GrpE